MHFTEVYFLDEFGEGFTQIDELIKKLICTCEEGVDYSFLDTTFVELHTY